jgi:hypothetical protein
VPRPPANLVLDFDSPALVASWEAVSTNSDGTAFVGAYEISFSAAGVSRTYTTTSPGFTYPLERNRVDFGTPQAELAVTVRAVGVVGGRSGALTGVATNEVPPTPTSPPLLVAGSTLVTVTATAPALEDLAGFDVYHSTSPAGPFELLVSTAGVDFFSHAVLPGSTHHYLYKIRDVFGQVSPGFSPTATTTTS